MSEDIFKFSEMYSNKLHIFLRYISESGPQIRPYMATLGIPVSLLGISASPGIIKKKFLIFCFYS